MYPFSTLKVINKSISPIAVTISGFIIGRLFTCCMVSLTIFRDLLNPIAVMVPTIVDTKVAIKATLNVV